MRFQGARTGQCRVSGEMRDVPKKFGFWKGSGRGQELEFYDAAEGIPWWEFHDPTEGILAGEGQNSEGKRSKILRGKRLKILRGKKMKILKGKKLKILGGKVKIQGEKFQNSEGIKAKKI